MIICLITQRKFLYTIKIYTRQNIMANIINLSKMAISAIMASDIDEDEREKAQKSICFVDDHERTPEV